MSDKIPYEDLIIPNLIDPAINTLSRQMAQYLIEKIYEGKNILITGSSQSGKTVLLNVLGKYIDMKKKIMCFEIKPDLVFLEHDTYYLNLENITKDKRAKEHFLISKGFSYYEEYPTVIMDDIPRTSFINYYRCLLSEKQVLAVIDDESNFKVINNLLYNIVGHVGKENIEAIGVCLMEKVDIIVHIRKYEDGYIRIKEISETQGYIPSNQSISLENIFEFITHGKMDNEGKLIGEFIRH